MANMDDDDMTVEEFDRLMAEATPVDVVVALNRPKTFWTTSVSHGGGSALGLQRIVKIQQGQLNSVPSAL